VPTQRPYRSPEWIDLTPGRRPLVTPLQSRFSASRAAGGWTNSRAPDVHLLACRQGEIQQKALAATACLRHTVAPGSRANHQSACASWQRLVHSIGARPWYIKSGLPRVSRPSTLTKPMRLCSQPVERACTQIFHVHTATNCVPLLANEY